MKWSLDGQYNCDSCLNRDKCKKKPLKGAIILLNGDIIVYCSQYMLDASLNPEKPSKKVIYKLPYVG